MRPLAYSSLWLLGFFMAVSQAAFCPREWLRYQRNCYGLFHEKLSWHEAEIRCQTYGRGTHLASILAWPETLIVSKHISVYMKEKGVDVWIGLNGIWRWTDESAFNYKNWMRGEPNNLWNSEYCVALRASTGYKGWIDAVCMKKKAFICKYQI
ncbi:C-type lectin-like [Protobothrops mucrosquamatus]|uniref:C-type lectin-like n=1 Tax=Protobothrops mucrosquamatus TaxID=103944 RepID=UPI0010FBBCA9|nr:C-type lectin-like [Protobothrops mucrosquamatus]